MNPYYCEVKHIVDLDFSDYLQLQKEQITLGNFNLLELREKYIEKYAWAIPDDEAIEICRRYTPIIEIGAGKGYWASLIRGPIVHSIQCFDTDISEDSYVPVYQPWNIDWESEKRTLMFCWPPYDEPMAYDYLVKYKGDTVIYIGEGPGGCTGDDQFHQELENKWVLIKDYDIPQWNMIHDRLYIYKRGEATREG